jgi:hypothetical protein
MRGWLATSVYGADGHLYGLLQLSDKSDGRDFDAVDEENIRELAALIGETLGALRSSAAVSDDAAAGGGLRAGRSEWQDLLRNESNRGRERCASGPAAR